MGLTGGTIMPESSGGDAQSVSTPARNKKDKHERRVGKVTGRIRHIWYRTSQLIGTGTNKILIEWPFRILCRHVVDMDLLKGRVDPRAPIELREPANGYKSHWEWLAEHCPHGWWWQEHGGNHNYLIYFRYKQDALRFKLIWG